MLGTHIGELSFVIYCHPWQCTSCF